VSPVQTQDLYSILVSPFLVLKNNTLFYHFLYLKNSCRIMHHHHYSNKPLCKAFLPSADFSAALFTLEYTLQRCITRVLNKFKSIWINYSLSSFQIQVFS
jgi:hypothetical protein